MTKDSSFFAEIGITASDFAPINWEFCNGQLLQIRSNPALFSLLGTRFGGDGENTFRLPDFQGRAPIQVGQGNNLSNYELGQATGDEITTLTDDYFPNHTHPVGNFSFAQQATTSVGTSGNPTGNVPANSGTDLRYATSTNATMAPHTVLTSEVGTSGNTFNYHEFNFRQPYLVLNFCICTNGIFPIRS